MNDRVNKQKTSFPFRTVFATVLLTSLIIIGGMFFSGYLHFGFQHDPSEIGMIDDSSDTTLYSCGMHPWIVIGEPGNCPICGMALTPKREQADDSQDTGERKIAYWRAPMNPMEIYNKPGKSAMGMDLVPVYDDEIIGGVEIKIDPVTQQNMGLRTARVEKGPLAHTIRAYGHITYDETKRAQINLKFSGWLEKLHVDFTGQLVEKGDPLFDIYSPELITVQEDYLEAYRNVSRNPSSTNKKMLSSVKRRLGFYDISEAEIRDIEKRGMAKKALTIRSPFKGVVTLNKAIKGGYVKTGTTVYEIADLSRVWVEAHIYEYELSTVSLGLMAEMTLPYLPGKRYRGQIAYIYPYLQRQTRDVVIRIEFENPDLELKPDMYANVRIQTGSEKSGIQIPSEAVLRSGERNIVFVSRGNGKFTPREVILGISLDEGKIHILTGLAPGEIIVTSGQFLLDSESKLKEATQKMLEANNPVDKPDTGSPEEQKQDDFFDDFDDAPSDTGSSDDFFDDLEN